MRKIIALLLALVMCIGLVACGSNTEQPSNDPGTQTNQPDQPNQPSEEEVPGEKVLRMGLGHEMLSLNPLVGGASGSGAVVCYAIYGSLWTITSDGEVNFEIAESYEYTSPDMSELVIKIREDACWDDGTPITADDLLFTFNYNMNGGMFFYVMGINFETSYAKDDKTLVLKLNFPSATFTEGLALIKIISKDVYEEKGEDGLGLSPKCSGAYKVEHWATGEDIILVKNPYYFNAENLIYDKIQISSNSDENTLFLNFKTGAYDIVALNDIKNIDAVENGEVAGTHHQVGAIQSFTYISMNTYDFDTFDDINIRAAIAHAVDWETIIAEICGGSYKMATSPLLPSANWAYKNMGVYEYNPELAASYLAKAGYGEGEFSFTLTVEDTEFFADIAEAMQFYLSEIGIDMQVKVLDAATVQQMNVSNQLEMVISKGMGASDPAAITNSRMSTSLPNATKFGPTAEGETYLMDLLDRATVSTEDQATRTAMFHEIQDLAWANYYTYPLYESMVHFAAIDEIGDFANAIDACSGFLHLQEFTVDQVTVGK